MSINLLPWRQQIYYKKCLWNHLIILFIVVFILCLSMGIRQLISYQTCHLTAPINVKKSNLNLKKSENNLALKNTQLKLFHELLKQKKDSTLNLAHLKNCLVLVSQRIPEKTVLNKITWQGTKLTLTGVSNTADGITNFLSQLSYSHLFQKITLAKVVSKDGQREFTIKCT